MPQGGQRNPALEAQFHEGMIGVYEGARDHCDYRATRFLQTVYRRGAVEAAKRLLAQPGTSRGFEELRKRNGLHLSMEALVLRPKYAELFTRHEKSVARMRLLNAGYDPDRTESPQERPQVTRREHM